MRIGLVTAPREITTELTKLSSFLHYHKRVVSTTLLRRLNAMLSADDTVWNGEVEAAVGVFEAQCQADLSFLSHQMRKMKGVHRHRRGLHTRRKG